MRTKTGIMLGLGETKEEVVQSMEDLAAVGVDVLTLGQYLQPTKKHLPVTPFCSSRRICRITARLVTNLDLIM